MNTIDKTLLSGSMGTMLLKLLSEKDMYGYEMIEKLSLFYNRARQASITQEITEIVAGAEGS